MMSPTLDTHLAVRNLEASGMVHKQAEAVVETIRRADAHLATKADVAGLRAEMKADLAALQAALEAQIAALRSWTEIQIADLRTELQRAVNRVLLAQAAMTALLFAALKLFE